MQTLHFLHVKTTALQKGRWITIPGLPTEQNKHERGVKITRFQRCWNKHKRHHSSEYLHPSYDKPKPSLPTQKHTSLTHRYKKKNKLLINVKNIADGIVIFQALDKAFFSSPYKKLLHRDRNFAASRWKYFSIAIKNQRPHTYPWCAPRQLNTFSHLSC